MPAGYGAYNYSTYYANIHINTDKSCKQNTEKYTYLKNIVLLL